MNQYRFNKTLVYVPFDLPYGEMTLEEEFIELYNKSGYSDPTIDCLIDSYLSSRPNTSLYNERFNIAFDPSDEIEIAKANGGYLPDDYYDTDVSDNYEFDDEYMFNQSYKEGVEFNKLSKTTVHYSPTQFDNDKIFSYKGNKWTYDKRGMPIVIDGEYVWWQDEHLFFERFLDEWNYIEKYPHLKDTRGKVIENSLVDTPIYHLADICNKAGVEHPYAFFTFDEDKDPIVVDEKSGMTFGEYRDMFFEVVASLAGYLFDETLSDRTLAYYPYEFLNGHRIPKITGDFILDYRKAMKNQGMSDYICFFGRDEITLNIEDEWTGDVNPFKLNRQKMVEFRKKQKQEIDDQNERFRLEKEQEERRIQDYKDKINGIANKTIPFTLLTADEFIDLYATNEKVAMEYKVWEREKTLKDSKTLSKEQLSEKVKVEKLIEHKKDVQEINTATRNVDDEVEQVLDLSLGTKKKAPSYLSDMRSRLGNIKHDNIFNEVKYILIENREKKEHHHLTENERLLIELMGDEVQEVQEVQEEPTKNFSLDDYNEHKKHYYVHSSMEKLKDICYTKYGYRHEYQIMTCPKESIRKKYQELVSKYYNERNSLYVGNRECWSGTNIPIRSGDFKKDCYYDYTFGSDISLIKLVGVNDPIPVDIDELNAYNERYRTLKRQEQENLINSIDEVVSDIELEDDIQLVVDSEIIVDTKKIKVYPFPKFDRYRELLGISFSDTSIDDIFEMKELRRADLFIDKQYRNVINEYNKSPSRSYTFMYNVYHRLLYHSLKTKKKINNLEWLPKLDYRYLTDVRLDDVDKFWLGKCYEVDVKSLFRGTD